MQEEESLRQQMMLITIRSAVPDRKDKQTTSPKKLQPHSLTQQRADEDDNLHRGGEMPVGLLFAVLLALRGASIAAVPTLPHHLPGWGVPHLQSPADSLERGMLALVPRDPAFVIPHGWSSCLPCCHLITTGYRDLALNDWTEPTGKKVLLRIKPRLWHSEASSPRFCLLESRVGFSRFYLGNHDSPYRK